MMYTMPKNLLSICVNFALATQRGISVGLCRNTPISVLRLRVIRLFLLFALAIAVLLGENTAAVILHVQAKLTRLILSFAEARRKVAVQILDTVFFGHLFADLTHQLVILVRADKQGRGKPVVAVLGGVARGFLETQRIAGRTAVVPVGINSFDELAQAVLVLNLQLEINAFCILNERILAHFVLFHRMNVGIVPKTYRLDTLLPQRVDARNGAGRTADMKKCSGQKIKPF